MPAASCNQTVSTHKKISDRAERKSENERVSDNTNHTSNFLATMIFTYQNFHGCSRIARESSQVGMISVFDELDSGVGGRIGTQIGEALRQLTKSGTQVICVTHLPQVAACGDLHLRVSKQIPFGLKDHASVLQRVEINVDTLNEEARIHEISSMLGLGNGQDSKEMAKCLLEATHSDETK